MLNTDLLRAFREAPRPLSLTEALRRAGAAETLPSRAIDALVTLQQAQLIRPEEFARDADGAPVGPRRYTAL